MTGPEFKAAVRALGLSPYAAAPMLGISPRMAQYIADGRRKCPVGAARLLAWELWAWCPTTAPPQWAPERKRRGVIKAKILGNRNSDAAGNNGDR